MVSLQSGILALAILGAGEGKSVLLDFYSDTCVPCRRMAPVVEQLTALGYPVQKLNVSHHPDLAARYGVHSLPCFVTVSDGQVVDRVFGETTLSRLEQMCKRAGCGRRASQPTLQSSAPKGPGSAPVPLPALPGKPVFSGDAARTTAGSADSRSRNPAALPDWRRADPSWAREGGRKGPTVDDLIAATVRLRIEDADGHSCGSGTIIDARNGEALILTCGHVFRDSKGKEPIEVDLFGPTRCDRVTGHTLSYDLERDIGLLTIRLPGPVRIARVAPAGYRAGKGDRVISVGCNHGDPPTARYSRVTSVDKFMGPPNLEVAGAPVEGRSGGGLFSEDGLVIGVCNAADPSENEGLYAALSSVHAQLDQARLSCVYRSGGENPGPEASLVAVAPPPMPKQMPQRSDLLPASDSLANPAERPANRNLADQPAGLSGEEAAALDEIRRRKAAGAEVICVIRSRSDPEARSEIIVLEEVSPAFLRQLAAEARSQPSGSRQLTSLEISRGKAASPRSASAASNESSASEVLPKYRGGYPRNGEAPDRPDWQPHWRESLPVF